MTVLRDATENLCETPSVDQAEPVGVDLIAAATLACDRDYTEGAGVDAVGNFLVDELGFAILDELGEEISYE